WTQTDTPTSHHLTTTTDELTKITDRITKDTIARADLHLMARLDSEQDPTGPEALTAFTDPQTIHAAITHAVARTTVHRIAEDHADQAISDRGGLPDTSAQQIRKQYADNAVEAFDTAFPYPATLLQENHTANRALWEQAKQALDNELPIHITSVQAVDLFKMPLVMGTGPDQKAQRDALNSLVAQVVKALREDDDKAAAQAMAAKLMAQNPALFPVHGGGLRGGSGRRKGATPTQAPTQTPGESSGASSSTAGAGSHQAVLSPGVPEQLEDALPPQLSPARKKELLQFANPYWRVERHRAAIKRLLKPDAVHLIDQAKGNPHLRTLLFAHEDMPEVLAANPTLLNVLTTLFEKDP
ncbi:hypothetical protein ACWD7F_39850, partial [Streptomyces sp. NPDC005122]